MINQKKTQIWGWYNSTSEKINHLGKNKKDHKQFMENNKLMLKTQQWLKGERFNVFTGYD